VGVRFQIRSREITPVRCSSLLNCTPTVHQKADLTPHIAQATRSPAPDQIGVQFRHSKCATREEFDLENRHWMIPAERSKNGKPHEVPLSDLALTLLHHQDASASMSERMRINTCALLAAFWLIVTSHTLYGAYHGPLFVPPCLSDGTGLRLGAGSEHW
jgi:hypothetical protein